MGDIIWGFILIVLTVVVYLLYRFLTRKKPQFRSLPKFVAILLAIGSSIGVLWTALNERLQDHPIPYLLIILFFGFQCVASICFFRSIRVGLPMLLFTLILQLPILDVPEFSYSSQTLFSWRIEPYPEIHLDIEPGSYVHYFSGGSSLDAKAFRNVANPRLGLNLIPLILMVVFLITGSEKKEVENSEH